VRGLRGQPEDQICEINGLVLMKKFSKAAQQFWYGQFFGENEASVCVTGFLPFLDEREKILTIEGHERSAFRRGKRQLLDIGQSEIASLLCG